MSQLDRNFSPSIDNIPTNEVVAAFVKKISQRFFTYHEHSVGL